MISSDILASEKKNNIQYGENNHIEYTWSNIQQENILQLSFQMVSNNPQLFLPPTHHRRHPTPL